MTEDFLILFSGMMGRMFCNSLLFPNYTHPHNAYPKDAFLDGPDCIHNWGDSVLFTFYDWNSKIQKLNSLLSKKIGNFTRRAGNQY